MVTSSFCLSVSPCQSNNITYMCTCKYYCHCIRRLVVALLPRLLRKSRTYTETCLSQKSYNVYVLVSLHTYLYRLGIQKKKKTKTIYGRSVNLRLIYIHTHIIRAFGMLYIIVVIVSIVIKLCAVKRFRCIYTSWTRFILLFYCVRTND